MMTVLTVKLLAAESCAPWQDHVVSSKRQAAKPPFGPLRLYLSAKSEQSPVTFSSRYIVSFSAFVNFKISFYSCLLKCSSLSLHWSSPGKHKKQPGTGHRKLSPPVSCSSCCWLILPWAWPSEELCRCGSNLVSFPFQSQFKAVSMRLYWRLLVLSQQNSSVDFQRSLISAYEGAGRGRFPAGEHRSGPPSCMPDTALWRPGVGRDSISSVLE